MFALTTEESTSPMFVLCVEKAFPGEDAILGGLFKMELACLIEASCDVVSDTQVKYEVFQKWEQ